MLICCNVSSIEMASLDVPLVHANFNNMYCNIMINDNTTLKALSYLQTCKNKLPAFDYQFYYAKITNLMN